MDRHQRLLFYGAPLLGMAMGAALAWFQARILQIPLEEELYQEFHEMLSHLRPYRYLLLGTVGWYLARFLLVLLEEGLHGYHAYNERQIVQATSNLAYARSLLTRLQGMHHELHDEHGRLHKHQALLELYLSLHKQGMDNGMNDVHTLCLELQKQCQGIHKQCQDVHELCLELHKLCQQDLDVHNLCQDARKLWDELHELSQSHELRSCTELCGRLDEQTVASSLEGNKDGELGLHEEGAA